MPARTIKKRTRFFFAGEGESEQSFVKWLQELTEQEGLHVHLHCDPLGGGGYQTMMGRAIVYRKRGLAKGLYKQSYLLFDGDRTVSGQDWSIDQLERAAASHGFTLCCQMPCLETLLLRMLPGKERVTVTNTSSAMSQLIAAWPAYQKPVDARTLGRQYSLDDLKRVAIHDIGLQNLLRQIGLLRN